MNSDGVAPHSDDHEDEPHTHEPSDSDSGHSAHSVRRRRNATNGNRDEDDVVVMGEHVGGVTDERSADILEAEKASEKATERAARKERLHYQRITGTFDPKKTKRDFEKVVNGEPLTAESDDLAPPKKQPAKSTKSSSTSQKSSKKKKTSSFKKPESLLPINKPCKSIIHESYEMRNKALELKQAKLQARTAKYEMENHRLEQEMKVKEASLALEGQRLETERLQLQIQQGYGHNPHPLPPWYYQAPPSPSSLRPPENTAQWSNYTAFPYSTSLPTTGPHWHPQPPPRPMQTGMQPPIQHPHAAPTSPTQDIPTAVRHANFMTPSSDDSSEQSRHASFISREFNDSPCSILPNPPVFHLDLRISRWHRHKRLIFGFGSI